jgi:hypothetical protein
MDNYYDNPMLFINQEIELWLCQEEDFWTCDHNIRVLMYIQHTIDWDNFLYVNRNEVCRALRLSQLDFLRAIKMLQKKNLIFPIRKSSGSYIFKLNEEYGFLDYVDNMFPTDEENTK